MKRLNSVQYATSQRLSCLHRVCRNVQQFSAAASSSESALRTAAYIAAHSQQIHSHRRNLTSQPRQTRTSVSPPSPAPEPSPTPNPVVLPWKKYGKLIQTFSKNDPQRRPLRDVLELGQRAAQDEMSLLRNAQHLLEGLQSRLAITVSSFRVLPEQMAENEGVIRLAQQMVEALQILEAFEAAHNEIDTPEKHVAFSALLRTMVQSGQISGDGEALAKLRGAVARARNVLNVDPSFFDHFVSSLLMSTVSCVVCIQHHLLLSDNNRGGSHIGAFDTRLRPVNVLRDCAFKTQSVCFQELGSSPRIDVKGDLGAKLEYIEPHFRYIMTEVLKNSVHATVRKHKGSGAEGSAPPVDVIVENDEDRVVVVVTDRGGGMCPTVFSNVWRYGYTTAHAAAEASGGGLSGEQAAIGSGLAGWGFGLPRSLVYARYLGGNMHIENIRNEGCVATITFPKAANDEASEFLSFCEIPHIPYENDTFV